MQGEDSILRRTILTSGLELSIIFYKLNFSDFVILRFWKYFLSLFFPCRPHVGRRFGF